MARKRVALDALQLPKSWLSGSALLQHRRGEFQQPLLLRLAAHGSPAATCASSSAGGRDLRSLAEA